MSSKIKSIIDFTATGINNVNRQISGISTPAASSCSAVDKLHKSIQKLTAISGITASVQALGAAKTVIMDAANAAKGVYDAVFNQTKNFAEQADQISKTSRLVNMSVKDFQGMRYAAERSGMAIETIDSSLQKFSVNTGQAINGNKTLASAFSALGVHIKNSDGSIRNNKDVLLDVADAYTKLKSSQDKAFISQTLFGKSGLQMAELFAGGKSGVNALLKDYNDLGGGISEEDAKNAEEFDDQLLRMNVAMGAIKMKVMGELMPSFIELFKTVTGYVKTHRKEIEETVSRIAKKVPDMIHTLSEKIPEIVQNVQSVIKKIEGVIDVIGPWKTVFIGIGAVVGGSVLMAVTAVSVAIATIGPIITGVIIPAIPGIAAAIAPVLATIGMVVIGIIAWKEVIVSVMDNWEMLKSFVVDDCIGGIMKSTDSFIDKISSGFTWVGDKIKSVFTAVKDTVLDVIRTVLNQYLSMADKITSTLSNLPGVGNIFKDVNIGVHAMMDSDFMNPQRQENSESMQQITQSYTETRNNTSTQRFAVDFSGMPRGVTVRPPEKGGDFDYSAGYLFGGGV